ncbi:hypothetical protein ACIA8E_38145 [Streptomyces sp. NPDC051664]|uniref:hypothetical protein n=1 Tax=Streptomyces sp. NPDC051664 TaxID=3365668 RepID=UPI0037A2A4E5
MSIVAERLLKTQVARVLRAGLAEEVERQTWEDDARGPEPEQSVVVTRTVLPVGPGWEAPELVVLPSLPPLPVGFVAAAGSAAVSSVPAGLGSDELRVRGLMIAAITRWGWTR